MSAPQRSGSFAVKWGEDGSVLVDGIYEVEAAPDKSYSVASVADGSRLILRSSFISLDAAMNWLTRYIDENRQPKESNA